MLSKDQWLMEYEQIGEQYQAGWLDRDQAEREMRALGFDHSEIATHLDALDAE